MEMALDHGVSVVKFFPCEAIGGLKTLKAIAAPYSMMRFIPTGGITAENIASYLAFKPILACGGSWMVGKELAGGRETLLTKLRACHAKHGSLRCANKARPGRESFMETVHHR